MPKVVTEIVTIGDMYAVRRTRTRFLFFTEVDFLNLRGNKPEWKNRDYDYFEWCLTPDINTAKKYITMYGADIGVAYANSVISSVEFSRMLETAKTDPGMADLLMKAKEYLLLKS